MDSKTLLYAGLTVACTFRDGTKRDVKLRLINISEIPVYLDLVTDEQKSLVYCIEVPALERPKADAEIQKSAVDFIDSLSDESYEELLAKNTELNFTRALAVTDRRLKRAEGQGVELARLATTLASLLSRFSPKSDSLAVTPSPNSTA